MVDGSFCFWEIKFYDDVYVDLSDRVFMNLVTLSNIVL